MQLTSEARTMLSGEIGQNQYTHIYIFAKYGASLPDARAARPRTSRTTDSQRSSACAHAGFGHLPDGTPQAESYDAFGRQASARGGP